MKRRGFMGGLAALLAAKPSPEKLAKINTTGLADYGSLIDNYAKSDAGTVSIAEPGDVGAYYRNQILELKVLRSTNPEWFHRRRLANSRTVTVIDADIATMHSWSLAAKITAQRQRNYDRALDWEENDYQSRLAETIFRHTKMGKLMAMLK